MKKWLALLLSGTLMIFTITGCTAKSSILSVEESSSWESSSEPEYDPENDTLLRGPAEEDNDSGEQRLSEAMDESVEMTEKEAKDLALSEAMRAAEQEGLEVDQTSVKLSDQDEGAFYVSVDCYVATGKESTENPETGSVSAGTNVYRVDKSSRDVSRYNS